MAKNIFTGQSLSKGNIFTRPSSSSSSGYNVKKQISNYKTEVIQLEDAIDSLQRVKNRILIKKDQVIVSKSASEGIALLQENLSK